MATTANTAFRDTLIDVAKCTDSSGKLMMIAEVLARASPAVQDAPYLPSNSPVGNRVTRRSSLPTAAWVRINQGIPRSKGTTVQVVDSMGMLAQVSETDVRLKPTVSDFNAFRHSKDRAVIQDMGEKVEETIFTGNESSDDASFTGFAPRFASKSTTLGNAGYQIVDAGGTGTDNTSIWIVDWGEMGAHLIHPPTVPAGLQHFDRGEQRVTDDVGNPFFAAVSEFQWTVGLSIQNLRHVCRVANIDKSDLATAGGASYSGPNIINLLIDAFHKMVAPGGARRVIYASRDVVTALDKLALNKSNLALSKGEWAGDEATMFRGAPIRETDALGADEARIV